MARNLDLVFIIFILVSTAVLSAWIILSEQTGRVRTSETASHHTYENADDPTLDSPTKSASVENTLHRAEKPQEPPVSHSTLKKPTELKKAPLGRVNEPKSPAPMAEQGPRVPTHSSSDSGKKSLYQANKASVDTKKSFSKEAKQKLTVWYRWILNHH